MCVWGGRGGGGGVLTTASLSMVALICSDPGVTVNNDLYKKKITES